jgi:hypothetical protein
VEPFMNPYKYRIIRHWLVASILTVFDEQHKTISEPDVTASLYMLPEPIKTEVK